MLIAVFAGIFGGTGGFGALETPNNTVHVFPLAPTAPAASQKPPTTTVKVPCPDTLGPVTYFANNPATASDHLFGASLVLGMPAFNETTKDITPSPANAQATRKVEWKTLCLDPERAKAVALAALPHMAGLANASWATQLKDLWVNGDWAHARLRFHKKPPTTYTMLMVAGKGLHGPPTAYIVKAEAAGWYLEVSFGSHTLSLRVGCGGQPSLDIDTQTMQGYQAPLLQVYHIFHG